MSFFIRKNNKSKKINDKSKHFGGTVIPSVEGPSFIGYQVSTSQADKFLIDTLEWLDEQDIKNDPEIKDQDFRF